MNNKTYAYIRVSTKEQNEDRQLISIAQFNIPPNQIFIDKQSGKDFNRPQYKKMMRTMKKNDLLIITSIDRLGRNYEDIMEEWKYITKKKNIDIKVIDMPLLDTTISKDLLGTFIADLVLQLLSFVAENERINIRQRQAEGIAAAKARGVKFGRPQKKLPNNFYTLHQKWQNGQISTKEMLAILDISRSTLYRKT
ncbi:MAG: recombinase family protein, partial [Clostridiales bacterium]